MAVFANRYYAETLTTRDARVFKSANAAHVIIYSFLMLIADKHNKSIRKNRSSMILLRTTLFSRNKQDFPKSFWGEVHSSIAET